MIILFLLFFFCSALGIAFNWKGMKKTLFALTFVMFAVMFYLSLLFMGEPSTYTYKLYHEKWFLESVKNIGETFYITVYYPKNDSMYFYQLDHLSKNDKDALLKAEEQLKQNLIMGFDPNTPHSGIKNGQGQDQDHGFAMKLKPSMEDVKPPLN